MNAALDALDEDSHRQLGERKYIGHKAIQIARGGEPIVDEDDVYFAAKDVVSDILTALYGPSGYHRYDSAQDESTPTLVIDAKARENAEAFVLAALESWYGDAEDYTTEPPERCHDDQGCGEAPCVCRDNGSTN